MARIRGRRSTVLRRAGRIVAVAGAAGFAVLAYVYLTLPDVRVLATVNPTSTAFMRLRADEAAAAGKKLRHVHRWVPYSRISKNLQRAVLVAEDDRFFEHEGIDMEEILKSIEINLDRGAAVRGASTITQQLAKNLYLSPSRDPLRKLRELIIARRLEAALSKARILELYLNLIEWGDGVWGAEAAARTYFATSAAALDGPQAALLAGAIINPRVLNPARPNSRLLRRQRLILARMRYVEPPPAAPAPPPVPETDTPEEFLPTPMPGDSLPPDVPPQEEEGTPVPTPAEEPPPVPAPFPMPTDPEPPPAPAEPPA